MIIGNFIYDKEADTFAGSLTTLSFQRNDVRFVPVKNGSDKGPNYRVLVETAFGSVELGAAWSRTSERGREFLSVSIDDPALPGALNAALFTEDNGETATLVWNRPKNGDKDERPNSGATSKTKAKAKKAA
jgi:uncharacterized protein (DUF736 family)